MKAHHPIATIAVFGLSALAIFWPDRAFAHCDSLDGPVVLAAQKALKAEDVNPVLIWVRQEDESEIRRTFQRTLAVRKLGDEARELADQHFFETLVRVHRAGEGAPYTGLKPAGRDLGPAIPAADNAIESGSGKALVKLLTEAVHHGLHSRFQQVLALKSYDPSDVRAGRGYVQAYVEYVHYVERIYESAAGPAHGHVSEDAEAAHHSGDQH